MKSAEAVLCGPYKFVSSRSAETEALYNIELDPSEVKNLLMELPRVSEKLRTLLRAQMQTQMRYHAPKDATLRTTHFAPRFASCPDLEEDFLLEDLEADSTVAVHAAAALQ
jgi:hypothetical protein